MILKLNPHSIARGFPCDIYSPRASLETKESGEAPYLTLLKTKATEHNLREFFIKKYNPNLDTHTIQQLLIKSGTAPKMNITVKVGNVGDDSIVGSFPEMSPAALVKRSFITPFNCNELIVTGHQDNRVVGFIFYEHLLDEMTKGLASTSERYQYYREFLLSLHMAKLPMFLIKKPDYRDNDYHLLIENKIQSLENKLKKIYKDFSPILSAHNQHNRAWSDGNKQPDSTQQQDARTAVLFQFRKNRQLFLENLDKVDKKINELNEELNLPTTEAGLKDASLLNVKKPHQGYLIKSKL